MKKYQVLLFDADETLFDFKKAERIALLETLSYFDLSPHEDYLALYQEENEKIWKELEAGLIDQASLKIERFERFFERAKLRLSARDFADQFMEELSKGSFLYPESQPLIDALKEDYRLAIVTNGLERVQERRIASSPIARDFEAIFISEKIGYSKPNPLLFEQVFSALKLEDLDKVLMIGDSLSSDIAGGQAVGIDTCWYNPHKKASPDNPPTYEIAHLHDLLILLK